MQTIQNDTIILGLKGRLDTLSSTELEKTLADLLAEKKYKLVIDFSDLDFISSSGLRVLLATGKQLKSVGGKIVLCALQNHVKEVFDVAGFTMLFVLYPSRDEAVKGIA